MSIHEPTDSEGLHVEIDAGFRFAMIPEAMLYSSISGTAVKVFGCLLRHGSDPSNCYPSHKRIAELVHVSVRTVQRAIDELAAAGWLSIVHRKGTNGGQSSNGYRLHSCPQGVVRITTPHDTSDLPPHDTSDVPPTSPVTDEREPLNESQLNETPLPPARDPRGAADTPGKGEAKEAEEATREIAAMFGGDTTTTSSEIDVTAKAMANGWTLDNLKALARAAKDNTVARDSHAFWVGMLRNRAGAPPAPELTGRWVGMLRNRAEAPPAPELTGQTGQTGRTGRWSDDWAVVARRASAGIHNWTVPVEGLTERGRQAAMNARMAIRYQDTVSAKLTFKAEWESAGPTTTPRSS